MLVNGDKLVVTKKVANFLDVGDIAKVINVDENGTISFAFGEGFVHMGVMSAAECEEYFEKAVEKNTAPTITQEHIDNILVNSEIIINTVFDKCTVVSCRLPNGFVVVESAACVSPDNYNEDIGIDICMKKIEDKIWELEGYKLQDELYGCDCDCECCWDCCDCGDEDCEDCEIDECLDTDLDCDDCEDKSCPYNSNRRI